MRLTGSPILIRMMTKTPGRTSSKIGSLIAMIRMMRSNAIDVHCLIALHPPFMIPFALESAVRH
jgi:hypothetical protein